MNSTDQRETEHSALPDFFTTYLQRIEPHTRGSSEAAERQTYATMRAHIDKEANDDIKQFMGGMLSEVCKDAAMLLSYFYNTHWHDYVRARKSLHKQVQPMPLYIALENIMARHTDSSTYTQNPTRARKTLTLPGNYSPSKQVSHLGADTPPPLLLNSFYKFGSHHFLVGRAIKGILDHLEERYGLDFRKLEKARLEGTEGRP